MNHDRTLAAPPLRTALVDGLYRGLSPLVADLRRLDTALQHLQAVGDETTAPDLQQLRQRVRDIAPSVTFIGQVKAGKTSLVNAMIGGAVPLPSDVNPWTSVVTSLHLSPTLKPANQRARFRFFTEAEWSNLLTTGGRVGELAQRAGADTEVVKVRRQLVEMREKSRQRLGASFELLMGQSHDYGYIDQELIERYVCLGDDFAVDTSADKNQGRFADITKSADLFVSMPSLPLPMCLRDTPGVNDTFMVREQITVNAIRGSRLCVVVLSAHQALSTVDLALIRLIANIPSRDVIIFVNRVDELADPANDIPEIRASILKTLASQGVSSDTEIVFGSAHWAHHALTGRLAAMGQASADALINLAEVEAARTAPDKDPFAMVWSLSGLPALARAISDRVVTGEGAERVDAIANSARNIANTLSASRAMVDRSVVEGPGKPVDIAELTRKIDQARDTSLAGLGADLDDLLDGLDARLEKSRQSFVSRAAASLVEHLETYGEDVVWTYDPAGLRLLLRTGYQVFTARASRVSQERFARCSSTLNDLFVQSYRLSEIGFELEPPSLPQPSAPVLLGQTIALDIRGAWWSRWWRRKRSYEAYAEEFRSLIDAEIAPMIDGLKADLAIPFKVAVTAELDGFIAAQRKAFLALAGRSQADLVGLRRQQAQAQDAAQSALNKARTILIDFTHPDDGRKRA